MQSKNDALPFDLGPLEIDQKAELPAGGSQRVETLGSVFVCEAFRTFEFDDQNIFNEDVGEIFANVMAFVHHWKRCLRHGTQSPKTKLLEQGALIDLLQKSGAERVGHVKDRANYLLRERIEGSAFVGVH